VSRTLKFTLQYDGTDYVGWQRQPNGASIQGVLEDALAPIEGGPVTVHGAGRTDAGVHALGQVASATVVNTLDERTLARALNAVLPLDVRVLSIEEGEPDFHARFRAVAKTYEYRIVNAPIASAFLRRYVWHIQQPLDLEAIRTAAGPLVGTHDFAGFQGAGTFAASTVRTILALDVEDGAGFDLPFVIRVTGDGFLRHMVRNIVGTLVEVGAGRWDPWRLLAVLESRDRSEAGRTAPPQGLFLTHVGY
jgi:tRNA pseudouridine38-40 synthase